MSGPLPHYRPSFPGEFVAEARRLAAARTAAAHLKQRASMVLLLHEQPALSNVEVGSRLGVHPNCVRRWRQRWAGGAYAFEDAPGRGRKPAFSPHGQGRRRLHRL
jgi:transposase-like protein